MKSIAIAAAAVLFAAASPTCALDMSFFITSSGPGKGADLGGLAGADAHCASLAEAAGHGGKTWRAYLSTVSMDGKPGVNARDRIGAGPWYNAKGVMIASNVDALHADGMTHGKDALIDEKGMPIKGRGESPNEHDILTGSQLDGTAFPPGADTTCRNWTSSAADGSARVGHHDRAGRAGPGNHPESWVSAHPSRGCGQDNLKSSGGNGYFYCFAVR